MSHDLYKRDKPKLKKTSTIPIQGLGYDQIVDGRTVAATKKRPCVKCGGRGSNYWDRRVKGVCRSCLVASGKCGQCGVKKAIGTMCNACFDKTNSATRVAKSGRAG